MKSPSGHRVAPGGAVDTQSLLSLFANILNESFILLFLFGAQPFHFVVGIELSLLFHLDVVFIRRIFRQDNGVLLLTSTDAVGVRPNPPPPTISPLLPGPSVGLSVITAQILVVRPAQGLNSPSPALVPL